MVSLPQEGCTNGSHLDHSGSQRLALHQRRWIRHLAGLYQSAGHPDGHRRPSWWHDQSYSAVTAALHGAASSVDQETHEEPEQKSLLVKWSED